MKRAGAAALDSRRLLRELPALLAGPEPVLESAAGREFLARDAGARGVLIAAAAVASGWEAGICRQRALVPAALPRELERAGAAVRQFRRAAVNVLFEQGMSAFSSATRGGPVYFEGIHDREFAQRSAADLERVVEGMAEALGVPARAGAPIRTALRRSAKHATQPSLDGAAVLFDACDALIPGLCGVRLSQVQIRVLRGEKVEVERWAREVERWVSEEMKAAGCGWLAVVAFSEGRLERALEFDEKAVALAPMWSHCYNAILHAAVGKSQRALDRFCESFTLVFDPTSASDIRQQVRSDAREWQQAARAMSAAGRELDRVVPQSLASAIHGTVA